MRSSRSCSPVTHIATTMALAEHKQEEKKQLPLTSDLCRASWTRAPLIKRASLNTVAAHHWRTVELGRRREQTISSWKSVRMMDMIAGSAGCTCFNESEQNGTKQFG